MPSKFLIHDVSHTTLLVDLTEIGLPVEVYPPEGKIQFVPTLRFHSWRDAERYLIGLGADEDSLKSVKSLLMKTSVTMLTIPRKW